MIPLPDLDSAEKWGSREGLKALLTRVTLDCRMTLRNEPVLYSITERLQ